MKHDFSTLRLPIEPGAWRDADDRIFHACFLILGQFVEQELGTEPLDIGGVKSPMYRGYRVHFADGYNEKAIDLWLWYRDELPQLQRDYTDDITAAFGGMHLEQDEKGAIRWVGGKTGIRRFPYDFPQTVKDEKLRELIELRRSLWT